ncbi:hypothetical protein [Oceanobacillus profundus]
MISFGALIALLTIDREK